MQARRQRTPTVSFFVRLWLEKSGKNSQWRGQVRHVQSGETAYFVDLQDLLSFLAAHGGRAFILDRKEVNRNVVSDHINSHTGELSD